MSQKPLSWRTEQRRVNSLLPHPKNPRSLDDAQCEALTKSLKKYGLAEIPAVNLDNQILAGHQRIKVLQLLGRGEEKIDVRLPSRLLTKQEADQYLLTSNAVHGSWDFDLLKSFPTDLILDVGFDPNDLAGIFDDALSVDDDDFDADRAIAEAKKTKIRPGDLFQVGPHRILCANSEDLAAVKRLVGDVKIDLVNIDFPYNINLDYNGGVGGKRSYGGHVDDKKNDAVYRAFVKNILQNAVAVSDENAHYFAWTNETYIGMMQDVFKECGIDFKRLCVWLKGNANPVPSVAFSKVAEWCSYGTRGKKPYLSDRIKNLNEVMNRDVDSGNRLLDDVADLFQVWLARRVPGQEMEHPTQKPPSLYEKSLRRCSKPGNTVLDLCSGSGSLAVACESLKRHAFLCDQEPVFVQVALDRITKNTNYHAKKLN
jgi:site-specific DNA-methyltransferase (adenine-specific)